VVLQNQETLTQFLKILGWAAAFLTEEGDPEEVVEQVLRVLTSVTYAALLPSLPTESGMPSFENLGFQLQDHEFQDEVLRKFEKVPNFFKLVKENVSSLLALSSKAHAHHKEISFLHGRCDTEE